MKDFAPVDDFADENSLDVPVAVMEEGAMHASRYREGGVRSVVHGREIAPAIDNGIGISVELHFVTAPNPAAAVASMQAAFGGIDSPFLQRIAAAFPGEGFYVAEYLEGKTLRELLDEAKAAGQVGLPLNVIHAVFPALCEGLMVLHRAGLSHGEVMPENVMLMPNPARVVWLNAGVNHILFSSPQRSPAGRSLRGRTFVAPDCKNGGCSVTGDIFALGILLYEMCTGKVPLGAAESITSQRSDLSERLNRTFDEATRGRADERPGSIDELLSIFKGITVPRPKTGDYSLPGAAPGARRTPSSIIREASAKPDGGESQPWYKKKLF